MSREPVILILGDTPQSRRLAHVMAENGLNGIYSHAGHRTPSEPLPLPTRIGGFGGADGLAQYLVEAGITHVIDATHPFTRTMSQNAILAATRTGLPLLAFTRPAWRAGDGDTWIAAPDMVSAVNALDTDPQRVFLSVPRQEVTRFAKQPQHHYLLRLATSPKSAPPLPDHAIMVGRGPFDEDAERRMLKAHGIGLILTRNTGAPDARTKLDAARALGLPVLMINRPNLPKREERHEVSEVLDWIEQNAPTRRRL